MTRILAYCAGTILALDGDRRSVWIPPWRSPISVNIMRWTGYSWASVIFYVGSRGREKRVRWLRAL